MLRRTQIHLVGRHGHIHGDVVVRVRVYVYANQIAARHAQINHKSKSGYRANSKLVLDRYCRLMGGQTDTQLLTSREHERRDSKPQKTKRESASSQKKENAFKSISLKLPQRQGVGGGN